ncbi:PC3-like endoprotease variant B [Hypanus sabinus]|uniref:PC3-like endoprotease variant B n=1 Tax=Hypanus sabinus TaxID=79690 RepID=UPI0028C48382|nr:PC3-like endoprotease variant B [Hypanus sabinus]
MDGHYILRDSRHFRSRTRMKKRLLWEPQLKWVEWQKFYRRYNRAPVPVRSDGTNQELAKTKDKIESIVSNVSYTKEKSDDSMLFNDPYWPLQWELYNRGQYGTPKRFDLNVMPVWKRNITGRGTVVSIIDDGVNPANLDLRKNIDLQASFDIRRAHGIFQKNTIFSRKKPFHHGTRCASEVAMEANNSFCGVGIAYNARVGGIRLLGGLITDATEATAFTYNNDYIDIYSCCWGPTDNGKTLGGPKKLGQKALQFGARKGRKGKGSIFVWASGNGGLFNDHCGADGFVNSIYTIPIGAVTQEGLPAIYAEPCPAVMAVTLNGATKEILNDLPLVTATNSVRGCDSHFRGTSSAAPLATGILALVLEANPDLSWRDVQHLIAKTAKIPNPLKAGWHVNGGGYHVHHSYGFGLMDAGLMVEQALLWTPVNPQRMCSEELPLDPVIIIPAGKSVNLHLTTNACEGTARAINTLEHVQAVVSITSVCRGDLSVDLISPFGTKSQLLSTRMFDLSQAGLSKWTFMSVHSWGENPLGTWTLKVLDNKGTVIDCHRPDNEVNATTVRQFKLVLWGTSENDKGSTEDVNLKEDLQKDEEKQLDEDEFILENIARVDVDDIPLVSKQKGRWSTT